MSQRYSKLYTRFRTQWDKMRLFYERGFVTRPQQYDILRLFPPTAHMGGSGRVRDQSSTIDLLKKFLQRYPEALYMEAEGDYAIVEGNRNVSTYAVQFVRKQRDLIRKGYTENAAFRKVEEEMGNEFKREKEEARILKGLAHNNRARSYFAYAQQLAEYEGRMKVERLDRDLSKFVREEDKWFKTIQGAPQEQAREKSFAEIFEEMEFGREKLDEYYAIEPKRYEPLMYQIINDPGKMQNTETTEEVHAGFV